MKALALRIIGLGFFLGAAASWIWRWEPARAFVYDQVFRMLESPTISGVIADYGVPIALVIVGAILFWLSSRRPILSEKRPIEPPESETPTSLDWSLRELFGYLAPHLPLTASQKNGHSTIGTRDERWEAIGNEVLKQLSLGRLHASGVGYRNITQRLHAAPIPPEFWRTAKFTYWFLDDDGNGILHAKNGEGIEYSDIEVNRQEALVIWPRSLAPTTSSEPWPDFKKWDKANDFELFEAACLWFDIEPRVPMPDNALDKYQSWRRDILAGKLSIDADSVRHAIEIAVKRDTSVTPHSRIRREKLVTLAGRDGVWPLFLFPGPFNSEVQGGESWR
jgi:hypothetical protein